MIATIVHIYVKPENTAAFIQATNQNCEASVKEIGNIRFDFLKDDKEDGKFILYEAYKSEETAKAHKETAHYIKWRDAVANWMAKPRTGVKHEILRPLKP